MIPRAPLPIAASLLATLAAAIAAPQPRAVPPGIRAESAIVVSVPKGRVLFEKAPDTRRPPASTQKLLTALLVVGGGDLDRTLTVTRPDTLVEPSKLWIDTGDIYTRRQLLNALLVKSANDAALSLARDHSGTIDAFAERMNAAARQLGMRDSHFVNPNGLPARGQFTTARDLARLALAAHANPVIRGIVRQRQFVFRYADGRRRTLDNTNALLSQHPYCDGMKTGYTEASGHCLVASASFADREVIAVILGSTSSGIWKDANALLDWALANDRGIIPYLPARRPSQARSGQPRTASDPYTTRFLID